MGHDHHHHLPVDHLNRAFVLGIVLNLVFVCVEFGAGLWFDSVALISDAGHNLSDVVSLVLSLIAFRLARVKPTASYAYGYRKSTVLVSLLNACILLVAVGVILVESVRKLYDPQPVDGDSMAWVAGIGIVINAFTAWLFIRDKEKDLNVKGAYLHMAADTLVSVGVLVLGNRHPAHGMVCDRSGCRHRDRLGHPVLHVQVVARQPAPVAGRRAGRKAQRTRAALHYGDRPAYRGCAPCAHLGHQYDAECSDGACRSPVAGRCRRAQA